MTFNEAVVNAVRISKAQFEIAYIYEKEDGTFQVGTKYEEGWIFRAYPGGRTDASMRGAQLIQQSTAAGRYEHPAGPNSKGTYYAK
jgi:hypothetical protein